MEEFFINCALSSLPFQEYDELTPMYERRKTEAIENALKNAQDEMQGIYLTQFIPKNRRNLQALTLTNGMDLAEEQRKNLDIQRMIKILNEETLPPNNINFCSEFFQKLNKHKKRLEVNNYTLYRKYFDNTGKITHKQIVVTDEIMEQMIKELHNDPLQGHPGIKKMLQELRQKYYNRNLTGKVTKFVTIANGVLGQRTSEKKRSYHPYNKSTIHVMDQRI